METKNRCPWCGTDSLYTAYHDDEWGKEVKDDRTMFEFLTLESAQAGLAWITILRKREGYRRAFAGFDPAKVAQFTDADVERLMQDPGIVRNRLRITAAIKNARLFLDIQKEFGGFCAYLRGFLPDGKPVVNHPAKITDVSASTPLSDAIAKDMKKR
ncbi:MAG: DNA-3-methyladenine glycosylase I, partial [Rikenellaceae bacterium]|nr:DNA-3-methyladenine glycosylase I [Rikenellaceae bacterium]